jgi:rare lipoprotein A (peptidoglycan hydrolase)
MPHAIFVANLCCALMLALGCLSASAQEGSIGIASFYAKVPERSQRFTAAHRTLPFGTMVSVTRIDTGAHVVVRINDRGPFIRGRIIDLSHPAAEHLDIMGVGLARVRVQVIPAPMPVVTAPHRTTLVSCCQLPPILE